MADYGSSDAGASLGYSRRPCARSRRIDDGAAEETPTEASEEGGEDAPEEASEEEKLSDA